MPSDDRTIPLVARPELVTPHWLTDVLHSSGALRPDSRVVSFDAAAIGTGQVGANVRFSLSYDGEPGPASVVGKFASTDPDSAAIGVAARNYEVEVAFYRDLAHTVDVSRPHCHHAAHEPGTANVVIVLEDLVPAEQGDQITGCTVEQAELAIDEAAKLHAPRWGDPRLGDLAWMNRDHGAAVVLMMFWPGFVDRYRETLATETLAEGERMMGGALEALQRRPVMVPTAVHGDFRLDNMLFDASSDTRPLTVVDWQTATIGAGPQDVAYFVGNAFADDDVRRAHQERLVRRYHDGLVERAVTGYSYDDCWLEFRRYGYSSLIMAIAASMLVGRTDRGDEMFMAMANRAARMANEIDTFGALTRA